MFEQFDPCTTSSDRIIFHWTWKTSGMHSGRPKRSAGQTKYAIFSLFLLVRTLNPEFCLLLRIVYFRVLGLVGRWNIFYLKIEIENCVNRRKQNIHSNIFKWMDLDGFCSRNTRNATTKEDELNHDCK